MTMPIGGPRGGAQGTLAPLHPLKLCSNYNNAKRLQHVAVIVSVIELLTFACMYN